MDIEKLKLAEEKSRNIIPTTWCKHTNKRILTLHPFIQYDFASAINILEKEHNIFVRLTDAFRTFWEQDKLYGYSRSIEKLAIKNIDVDFAKPHKSWRTNAIGGQSFHNYGLAGDVVEIKNNKALYSNADWNTISKVFKDFGFEWMFDLIRKDKPHFQMRFGFSWQDLKKLHANQNLNKSYIQHINFAFLLNS